MRRLRAPLDDRRRPRDLITRGVVLHLDRVQPISVAEVDGVRIVRTRAGDDQMRLPAICQRHRHDRAGHRSVGRRNRPRVRAGDAVLLLDVLRLVHRLDVTRTTRERSGSHHAAREHCDRFHKGSHSLQLTGTTAGTLRRWTRG